MRTIINHNNSYKVKLVKRIMNSKIILVTSMTLFVLVLIGVYMMIINQTKQFVWIQPLIPLIVLTGFFIFIISAGLFIYGLIKLIKRL
jgi:sterol desaturase/sphingolipid hydroxylase (fatty acid hydroxylase superfamily)